MLKNLLAVPTHLAALFVKENALITESFADFSKLPFASKQRDYNPDTPHLSESILSEPFKNQNLNLSHGLHLHWSLPDALTKGSTEGKDTSFPAVPNVWIISRTLNGKENHWIVESDFVCKDTSYGGVTYPLVVDCGDYLQPFGYLGRQLSLDDWIKQSKNNDAHQSKNYLPRLTAIGYGEPAFAALYSNCATVFGFHDPEITEPDLKGNLSYQVIGWYSKNDPLTEFIQKLTDQKITEHEVLAAEVRTNFGWNCNTKDASNFPSELCCYAHLDFKAGTSYMHASKDAHVKVSIGNTATEAMAAFVSQNAVDNKALHEEMLESMLAYKGLSAKQLDLWTRFKEARHERSFKAEKGARCWTIQPKDSEKKTIASHFSTAYQALDALNEKSEISFQKEYELKQLKETVFSDWYKYMLCAYPPDDARDNYPDMDFVKNYFENVHLPEISLAETRYQTACNDLTNCKATLDTLLKDDPLLELKEITAPRFWQPAEPVMLLEGEAVQATIRHGADGHEKDDNTLDCTVISYTSDTELKVSKLDLVTQIRKLKPLDNVETIGYSIWQTQPWNPLFLEWEVEILPLLTSSNLGTGERVFDKDFFIHNYSLTHTASDVCLNAPLQATTSPPAVLSRYSGRNILSPHSKTSFLKSFLYLLEQSRKEDIFPHYANFDKEKQTKASNWYSNIQGILSSYKTNDRSLQALKAKELSNIIQELLKAAIPDTIAEEDFLFGFIFKAVKAVNEGHFLSQALGGFNNALLMLKQTLQLAVADPIGFKEYKVFADAVAAALQTKKGFNEMQARYFTPVPHTDFLPVRSGSLKIHRLRLIDSFGQIKELSVETVLPSASLSYEKIDTPWLPPRFVQPVRLHFRWLAADSLKELPMHPGDTPVCGWLIANHLDNSLMVYSPQGQLLGYVNKEASWQPSPGSNDAVLLADIPNPYLKELITSLVVSSHSLPEQIEKKKNFLKNVLAATDNALDTIDPEYAAHHQDLTLLMGRPMVVVKASLQLQLKGQPATHHGWKEFWQTLEGAGRDTNGFEKLKIPVKIGDRNQYNDGVVGYWINEKDGLSADFYSTVLHAGDGIKDNEKGGISLTLDQKEPSSITLLMDPHGDAFATTGVLPAKAIHLPRHLYTDILKKLQVTFLTTPLLTSSHQMAIPLPKEAGFQWSWVSKQQHTWKELSEHGVVKKEEAATTFAEFPGLWDYLLEKKWLEKTDDHSAFVVPKDQRLASSLEAPYDKKQDKIQFWLDAGHIVPVENAAVFNGKQVIIEGWLKLSPTNS